MLVTADWVLPVASPPIRDGAVVVRGSRIAEVGPRSRFEGGDFRSRTDLPGCVLAPGLVNAHTHLSLTALEGVLPPMPFPDWVRRLVSAMRTLSSDDLASSAALGALRCLKGGVTVVGDITYGPEALAAASDSGLGGVFFWEVLGVEPHELPGALARAEFPDGPGQACTGRVRCSVSPHSLYTSGPALLRAVAEFARDRAVTFAIHVAESPAERELAERGTGPLADTAARLARGFESTGLSPVAYLHGLGALDGGLAVHCVQLEPGDAHLLASSTHGVVLCPRSNAYLGSGTAPLAALLDAGARLALGTDSAASNDGLDLFAEARAVRGLDRRLTPARLIAMMTTDGARSLGLAGEFGTLAPYMEADLVAVRTGPTDEPEAAFVELGGPDTVEAVASAGVWRVRSGATVVAEEPLLRAAALIRDRMAGTPDA